MSAGPWCVTTEWAPLPRILPRTPLDLMIRLANVTKQYGTKTAVRDLSLEVRAGELFAFLGPNGAGKTTTIKMMCGLLFPTSGTIAIGGHDLRSHGDEARKLLAY